MKIARWLLAPATDTLGVAPKTDGATSASAQPDMVAVSHAGQARR
jgi:hypothetical protein